MARTLKLVILLFLLAAVIDVYAQPAINNAQTLLWKISGHGLKKDSYISLTTANACVDLATLNKKTLAVLGNVQVIAVESGLNDQANEAALQQLVLVKNENGSLRKLLSSELYNELVARSATAGISEEALNAYKPMFICGLTIQAIAPCKLQEPKTMEALLRACAKEKNIRVQELLSLPEAFSNLDAYPNTYWETILDYLINHAAQAAADLDNKTNLYQTENLGGLTAIQNESILFKTRYAYNDIEKKRVALMGSKIDKMIKDQSTIFLIDASAVTRPETSVFSYLTKLGYKISPIITE